MTIPPHQLRSYNAYITKLAEKLGATTIDPNTILWHYTTGMGLAGILDTHTIFSTQISCLNDSREVLHAAKLFRDSLQQESVKYAADSPEAAFIKRAVPFFQSDPESPNHVRLPYLVTCFSEIRDDLAQWRAYGSGENGYALGFRAGDLFGIPNSIVARVIYPQPEAIEGILIEVAEYTLNSFRESETFLYEGDVNLWVDRFLGVWDPVLTQVAPMIKHPGFAGEREFRIIKAYNNEDLSNLKFVQKSALLACHLPLTPKGAEVEPFLLPIREVQVGPCRYPHVSRTSVATLLQQKGYNIPVTTSDIPFQTI